jgi:uncharacterized protein YbbK (DUF523 family)/uncharacterized protein YbgA (DUF1722 family)
MRSYETEPGTERERGAWSPWHAGAGPIRLGISTCLLGEKVRYDGGHKRDDFLVEELGRWVTWTSVCPEVELGMPIPRPSVRLVDVGDANGLRMLSPATGEDYTERMRTFSRQRVAELRALELDGYVLKKNSPSCGMTRVKVWGFAGLLGKHGVGLYAQALLAAWPHLPVEEEGRLADPMLRENFVERIFSRNRWRSLVKGGRTRVRLVEFWTAHELLARAHDESGYQRLGKLVGSARKGRTEELYAAFEAEFFATLAKKATVRKHTSVLQHAMGHLREHLDAGERGQLADAIEEYRQGRLPLVVPVTLLRFQIRKHQVESLLGQLYFDPHPKELMLRNRV